MNFVIDGLRNNPELAIILTLAIGFLIGRMKFGSFSLGIVVGTLLAGVVIGQLDIKVSPLVKTVFFDLFLFTTGYDKVTISPEFHDVPILEKPIDLPAMAHRLAALIADPHG